MILGSVTSVPCIAVTEKTKADNMFQLTPSGSAVECAKYANNFRVCFSDPDQGAASARYIGENNLGTKVAVIYDSSTVYSTGIYESFVQGAASLKLLRQRHLLRTTQQISPYSFRRQRIQARILYSFRFIIRLLL